MGDVVEAAEGERKTRRESTSNVEPDKGQLRPCGRQSEASKKPQQTRPIAPAEVRAWFKSSRTPLLNDTVYDEIAGLLTKMRWPSDPDLPEIPKQETDADKWWDFRRVPDAAKMLLASMPAMLLHWEKLRWAPETRVGYEVIKELSDALSRALPYIEFPFGEYERLSPQKRPKKHKNWHMAAISVAHKVVKAITPYWSKRPSIHRNSIVIKVVREALGRMGYPKVEASAISAHLTRFDLKFGLFSVGMTTK
jgi:hypothetical protein